MNTEREDYLFCALLGLGKVYKEKAYLTLLTMFTMKLTKDIRFQTLACAQIQQVRSFLYPSESLLDSVWVGFDWSF